MYVHMFLQAWFLPNTPQIRGGGWGEKSTALFEENLSLICCSCGGAFGQLNRAGFGPFPNEGTTCYPWIGHLGGTVGHRGIWLSFPLWSAWGKQGRKKKRVHFIYLMSCHLLPCSIKRSNSIQSEQERLAGCDEVQDLGMRTVWLIWGVINIFLFLCCNSINVKALLISRRYGKGGAALTDLRAALLAKKCAPV